MDKDIGSGALAALKQTWSNLTGAQRLVVASLVVLSVVIVVVVSVVGTRPSMATLFSNLESTDAAAIVDRLRDLNVPYEISNDGAVIKVPSNQVYDLRLKMVNQGLPAGGTVGFEIFDKNTLGMSEFSQQMNYRRALQGELSRTIGQMSGVESVRVHLALPEERLYSDSQKEATASVALGLRRGVTLSDGQIAGVVHLVASSVEGLKPENVTVVDTQGTVLSEAGGQSGGLSARLTVTQVKLKRDYERSVQKDVQSMLDNIAGPGKAVVRVSARMNFDQKQVTSEVIQPGAIQGKGVLVSEETVNETYSGAGAASRGRVGVVSGRAGATAASGDSYTHTETNAKYEVTRSTEQVVSAPGRVERLSLAVMLDDSVRASTVAAVREAVGAAVGLDMARGDTLTVSRVKFDRSAESSSQAESSAAARADLIKAVARNGGAVAMLILFVLFVRAMFKSVKFHPVARDAAHLSTSAEQMVSRAYSEDSAEAPAVSEAAQHSTSEQIVQELAKNKPEEVANVVRAWISESR